MSKGNLKTYSALSSFARRHRSTSISTCYRCLSLIYLPTPKEFFSRVGMRCGRHIPRSNAQWISGLPAFWPSFCPIRFAILSAPLDMRPIRSSLGRLRRETNCRAQSAITISQRHDENDQGLQNQTALKTYLIDLHHCGCQYACRSTRHFNTGGLVASHSVPQPDHRLVSHRRYAAASLGR